MRSLIFVILAESFPNSLWFNASVAAYWKHLLLFLLMGFIVTFFIFYPLWRVYIWSTTIRIFLWHLYCNKYTHAKIKYYLSFMFPIQIDIYEEVIQNFFRNFICVIVNLILRYHPFNALNTPHAFRRNIINCYC